MPLWRKPWARQEKSSVSFPMQGEQPDRREICLACIRKPHGVATYRILEFLHPTKLGKTVFITGLSPERGAIIAGFLRVLIQLEQKHEESKGRPFGYLWRLTDIDLLFICCACYECRDAWIRSPSKQDVADVQEFLETLPPDQKPIVNFWRDETSSEFPTRRLLTSLKVPFEGDKTGQPEKFTDS
jgi:hypothetical protein